MDASSLRSPIVRQTIETLNEGRLDDFMALFAHNATVVDEATYSGYETIREWTERENFGVHMHLDVEREKNAEGTVIETHATSHGGYNGRGTLTFTIRGNLIERLVIS